MIWYPINTFPHDGKDYLTYNKLTNEYMVLNQPKNHALGRWYKDNNEWNGSFISTKPTNWCRLPDYINDDKIEKYFVCSDGDKPIKICFSWNEAIECDIDQPKPAYIDSFNYNGLKIKSYKYIQENDIYVTHF